MRILLISILGLLTLASCTKQEPMEALIDRVFTVAEQQYTAMDTRLTEKTLPRTLSADGEFVPSNIYWWCSGFYPGSLWYIYEYTGNEAVKTLAEKNTLKLDSIQYVTRDHDVGFQLNCSYGNAFRLTGNEAYKQVLYQGAKSLSTRFNPAAGVIRSWDFVRKGCDWKFPVIIDNMMNLELLLSMSKAYADDSLQNIACTHANTTIQHHFRDDYSTYHLVDYDPETGAVRGKQTVQGFSDDSSWSRGQAWALYSYTMMFRLTGVSELSVASRAYRRYAAPPFACRRYSLLGFRRSGRRTDLSGCFRCGYHGLRLYRAKPLYPRHGGQGILSCHGRKATPYACLERVSGRTGYERMFHPEAQRGCTS